MLTVGIFSSLVIGLAIGNELFTQIMVALIAAYCVGFLYNMLLDGENQNDR